MSAQALDASVLVLNKSFSPVNVTTAKRAFCMLCKSVAQVVDTQGGQLELHNFRSWRELSELRRESGLETEHSDWISTVSYELQVPRVIRLLFFNRHVRQRATFNRRNIFARDENTCQYCGQRFPTSELSIDHVVPLAQNGSTCWENVVCSCTDCNHRKGGRRPEQAGMELIREPFAPKTDPIIKLKLRRKKYRSWKQFLDDAYWSVELE